MISVGNTDVKPDEFPDQGFTEGLCSHSGKKFAVRLMGRFLNPLYVIFRAGWEVRNANTIFDYMTREVHHDIEAAKVSAGWKTKLDEQIYGGYPNDKEDLSIAKEKFDAFCTCLFSTHLER